MCIYMFRMFLITNGDYCPEQHQPADLCNGVAIVSVNYELNFVVTYRCFSLTSPYARPYSILFVSLGRKQSEWEADHSPTYCNVYDKYLLAWARSTIGRMFIIRCWATRYLVKSVARSRNNRTAVLRNPFLGDGQINMLPRIMQQ
jgi:hypothetical protein